MGDLGGRGAGKTRAGAEWVRGIVEGPTPSAAGAKRRIGLIAETYEQAREIMVFGESGILAVSPPEQRPKWIAGRRMLEWPNGATAQIFSAHDPDSLRGPQFDTVWVDEFAKWRKAEDAWDMIQFCLRLGDKPQAFITTTPRNNPALRALLNRPSTVKNSRPNNGKSCKFGRRLSGGERGPLCGYAIGSPRNGWRAADGCCWFALVFFEVICATNRSCPSIGPDCCRH